MVQPAINPQYKMPERQTADREDVIHYSEQQSGPQGMHWLLNDAFAILIGLAGAVVLIWAVAYMF